MELWKTIEMYAAVILPPAGVGLIFYLAMKAIFNADRLEREAQEKAHEETVTKSVQK